MRHIFGATIGNMLMMQSLLIAQKFGVLDYPRIAARQGLISFTGTAGGPLLLGVMHDFAGGYRSSHLADRFDSVQVDQWQRRGFRSDGSVFTLRTIAQYLLHDPVHHLWDVGAPVPKY